MKSLHFELTSSRGIRTRKARASSVAINMTHGNAPQSDHDHGQRSMGGRPHQPYTCHRWGWSSLRHLANNFFCFCLQASCRKCSKVGHLQRCKNNLDSYDIFDCRKWYCAETCVDSWLRSKSQRYPEKCDPEKPLDTRIKCWDRLETCPWPSVLQSKACGPRETDVQLCRCSFVSLLLLTFLAA